MAAFPTIHKIGLSETLVTSKGALKADVGMIVTTYSDLATANANPYIKDYAGALIVTSADIMYYRNQAVSDWITLFSTANFILGIGNAAPYFTASVSGAQTPTPTISFNVTTQAVGTILGVIAGAAAAPVFTSSPALGETGVTGGQLIYRSATAGGQVTTQLVGSSGNWNWNWPLNAGTIGWALLSGGGGSNPNTWGAVLTGVTADNGLTANTSTNIQLGGTLIKNTEIDTAAFRLDITSFTAGVTPLQINSGTGTALSVFSNGGAGAGILAGGGDRIVSNIEYHESGGISKSIYHYKRHRNSDGYYS